jgi:hypothetical protein
MSKGHGSVNLNVDRGPVEEIVMVRAIEEVNHGAKRGILTLRTIGESVDVDLASRAPVKVGNFENEVDGLQENVDEEGNAQMLNLTIHPLNDFGTIAGYAKALRDKRLVRGGIRFQTGAGKESEVVDDGVGAIPVVEPIRQDSHGRVRIHHVSRDILEKTYRLLDHVLEQKPVIADGY